MFSWVPGGPIPVADDYEEDDGSAVLDVGIGDDADLIHISAWDDGLGLDVHLLLDLDAARLFRDRVTQAITAIESR
ncbi:hypothetical protein GCM10022221_79320 [Actinocorallia aurea]